MIPHCTKVFIKSQEEMCYYKTVFQSWCDWKSQYIFITLCAKPGPNSLHKTNVCC